MMEVFGNWFDAKKGLPKGLCRTEVLPPVVLLLADDNETALLNGEAAGQSSPPVLQLAVPVDLPLAALALPGDGQEVPGPIIGRHIRNNLLSLHGEYEAAVVRDCQLE